VIVDDDLWNDFVIRDDDEANSIAQLATKFGSFENLKRR